MGSAVVDRTPEQALALLPERVTPVDIVFRPYLAGERAPYWNHKLTATFEGLRGGNGPADLLAAALQGVALQERLVLETAGARGGMRSRWPAEARGTYAGTGSAPISAAHNSCVGRPRSQPARSGFARVGRSGRIRYSHTAAAMVCRCRHRAGSVLWEIQPSAYGALSAGVPGWAWVTSRLHASHGFRTGTCALTKSLVLRETIVRLCRSAVAASSPSTIARGVPWLFACAASKPHRSLPQHQCQDPSGEADLQIVFQPHFQVRPSSALRKNRQTFANHSKRQNAQV